MIVLFFNQALPHQSILIKGGVYFLIWTVWKCCTANFLSDSFFFLCFAASIATSLHTSELYQVLMMQILHILLLYQGTKKEVCSILQCSVFADVILNNFSAFFMAYSRFWNLQHTPAWSLKETHCNFTIKRAKWALNAPQLSILLVTMLSHSLLSMSCLVVQLMWE